MWRLVSDPQTEQLDLERLLLDSFDGAMLLREFDQSNGGGSLPCSIHRAYGPGVRLVSALNYSIREHCLALQLSGHEAIVQIGKIRLHGKRWQRDLR